MIRALCLALALCAAAPLAAPLDIATRGQAQLVARRRAIDQAVEQLAEQAMAIEVQTGVTLGAWLAERPDVAPDVHQALRSAEMTTDAPSGGHWRVAMQFRVADLNAALESSLRLGLVPSPDTELRAEGSAAIAWVGEGLDEPVPASSTPPREETAPAPIPMPNLPPNGIPPVGPQPPTPMIPRQVIVDPAMIAWDEQVSLSTTGSGRTPAAAAADARRELLGALRALPVAAGATVGNWADASPRQAAALDGLLSLALESERRLTPDGVCEVDLAVPLTGLRLTLLNEEMQP